MTRNEVVATIPARLGSTRFPNKILYPLHGRPLIYHVWREAAKIRGIDRLVIVTDSPEIETAARSFSAEVIRSSSRPKTGSDRLAEVMAKLPARFYLNIQGDNVYPFARSVSTALASFRKSGHDYGTLGFRITDDEALFDPKMVKLVMDGKKRVLWFSRFPIPYVQKPTEQPRNRQAAFYGHVGIYLYSAKGLRQYGKWKQTPAERAESLEQLRILENGEPMAVYLTNSAPVSVDTPADINKIQMKPRIG